MVEGADVNEDIDYVDGVEDGPPFFTNWFNTAELIGLNNKEVISFPNGVKGEGVKGHSVYAMYGNNKVVESFVGTSILEQFIDENRGRIISVHKKPYLLNGEVCYIKKTEMKK